MVICTITSCFGLQHFQVCESVRAIVQGQGVDDMDPFVDLLLAEERLKGGAEQLVSELLAVAIGQGMDQPLAGLPVL